MRTFDIEIDVTEVAAFGRSATTVATVFMPEPERLSNPPVVCFAFPGGGYNRRYFSFDMPDSDGGGQAGFHVGRGWVFVACDSLGFGDATNPGGTLLNLDNVAAANAHTVATITRQLREGTLSPDVHALGDFTTIGLGQSMGGCFTIVQQAQFESFDAIGVLAFSSIVTHVPSRPGVPSRTWPWMLRSRGLEDPLILNRRLVENASGVAIGSSQTIIDTAAEATEHPFKWAFHWDDEPTEIVEQDMRSGIGGAPVAPWRSPTETPACGDMMAAPGVVATEAASITVPVLVALGERDVIANPAMESLGYRSASDFSLFICPRMAHMHNFACTRHLLWQRIHSWGEGVVAMRASSV